MNTLFFVAGLVPGFVLGKMCADFEIKKVYGCYGRLYMTRTVLLRIFSAKLMINYFHHSDDDRNLHDHPWTYWSFILWNGYREHTRKGVKRIRPLSLIHRPCWWSHRVELIDGRPAITLVVTGRKVREWGFYTKEGWMQWEEFIRVHCNEPQENP